MENKNCVFINCPFDKPRMDRILKPILFCLLSHDLHPVLTLDIKDSGQLRIEKIVDMMKEVKYSIHDLSLLKVKKVTEFARMNMPYELGIDYGLRSSGIEEYKRKRFLVMGSKKFDYMKAISDISGFDIMSHENSMEKVFDCMHSWLSSLELSIIVKPSLALYYDFINFNGWLYSNALDEYGEDVCKDYLEKMEMNTYKSKIEEYLNTKK